MIFQKRFDICPDITCPYKGLVKKTQERTFWELKLKRILDLCDANVYSAFSNTSDEFKDIKVARSIAALLRNVFQVEAIFAPSMSFLDDLSKWCLVVFLEKVPSDVGQFILDIEARGFLEVG